LIGRSYWCVGNTTYEARKDVYIFYSNLISNTSTYGDKKMINESTQQLIKVFFPIIFLAIFSTGCTTKNIDGTKVDSKSKLFTEIAKNLQEPCSNPAEFGRCGCRLDGLRTSCDIVNRCLENGFCVVARE